MSKVIEANINIRVEVQDTPSTLSTQRGISKREISKRYPTEPAVEPHLIREYLQNYNTLGPEHSDTEGALNALTNAIQFAKSRGFDYERFNKTLEDVLGEAKRNLEGRKLGEEHTVLKNVRETISQLALETIENDNQDGTAIPS